MLKIGNVDAALHSLRKLCPAAVEVSKLTALVSQQTQLSHLTSDILQKNPC